MQVVLKNLTLLYENGLIHFEILESYCSLKQYVQNDNKSINRYFTLIKLSQGGFIKQK